MLAAALISAALGENQIVIRDIGDDAPQENSEHRNRSEDLLSKELYDELRLIAAARLTRERPDHTLQATSLVHEAVMKLIKSDMTFEDRAHFLATAAKAVRRVLVDHARARNAQKRLGEWKRVTLDLQLIPANRSDVDPIAVDEAVSRLTEEHGRPGRVAELRFFGDLTLEETACVLDVSRKTVTEDWAFARAWLARELSDERHAPPSNIA